MTPKNPFRARGILAARAADEKKADQIVLRQVGDISPLTDFMLVASVGSRPQMESVQEWIKLTLKAEGLIMSHRDGSKSDLWRVLDYGGLDKIPKFLKILATDRG